MPRFPNAKYVLISGLLDAKLSEEGKAAGFDALVPNLSGCPSSPESGGASRRQAEGKPRRNGQAPDEQIADPGELSLAYGSIAATTSSLPQVPCARR